MKRLASLLLLLALPACPSEPPVELEGARFADATPAQLRRAAAAATATDAQEVLVLGMLIAGQDAPDGCPRIVTAGDTTTASGDCDDPAGGYWDGTVVSQNAAGFIIDNPGYDPGRETRVRAEDLVLGDADGAASFVDGNVVWDPARSTFDAIVDVERDGVFSSSTMHLTCTGDLACSTATGRLEIDDLGDADVSGTWRLDSPASGEIMVRGADELVLDVGAMTADRCIPYSIDGEPSGEVCDLGR